MSNEEVAPSPYHVCRKCWGTHWLKRWQRDENGVRVLVDVRCPECLDDA